MKIINKLIVLNIICLLVCPSYLSSSPQTINEIENYINTKGKSYIWLKELTTKIGHRISGSKSLKKAVKWGEKKLNHMNAEQVYLQDVMVPTWVRGKKETLIAYSPKLNKTFNLEIRALGSSIGTPKNGISTSVIEVNNFEELEALDKTSIQGKFVFYNHPMESYGKDVIYRYQGASKASALGAKATILRSLTKKIDNYPHTGNMAYDKNYPKIPASAISSKGAELLSALLKEDPNLRLTLKMYCKWKKDSLSHNVIGEIKGSEFPNEIIVIGGHLDSWDVGQGAHDDGAGVVQALDTLNTFIHLNIKPKRTIRVVLFTNEENGLRGANAYAKKAKETTHEKHIAAIESDSGGFYARGFGMTGSDKQKETIFNYRHLFTSIGLTDIEKAKGGADISPLKDQGTLLIGIIPDSHNYFDYHHTDSDTFDKINEEELKSGTIAMATLAYIISEYGLNNNKKEKVPGP